ncbi:TolC family protein [Neptuniibacter sp. QD37_11]|uniref:TolC family protein n=1 Tax=Neptuniibacter sp. QD37_11 TaxID=3398209 RepID=UPI0039F53868
MLKRLKPNKKSPVLSVISMVVLLQGCMQTITQPEITQIAEEVRYAVTSQLPTMTDSIEHNARWWQAFASQELDQLVATALENNRDLRATRLRVEAAAARLRLQEDQQRPQGGLYTDLNEQQAQLIRNGEKVTSRQGRIGIEASWNLDLFGRIEASIRAVEANLQRQAYANDQVIAEIITAVVETYTRLAGAQAQLVVLEQQLASINQTVATLDTRVKEGFATPLELYRAKVLRYEFEAKRPLIAEQAAQYRSSLATLVGEMVPDLAIADSAFVLPDSQSLALVFANPQQSILDNPELLQSRTNVLQAAALSDQAKAALYPDISISGLVGWLSAGTLQLDQGEANLSITPRLQWSLLNLSALRANLQASQLEEQAVLAEYEKQLLLVLNNADQSIKTWNARNQRMAYLNERHFFAQKAENQAKVRYEEGAIPYVDYLDAQRELLAAEDAQIIAKIEWSSSYADLYRAFAGSWLYQLDQAGIEKQASLVKEG